MSLPTYNTPPDLLRRAVDSILAQDVDLRLVVVNDGGDPPWDHLPDDPRITAVDLPRNVGRYHADATVLAATSSELWTPHDSDDLSRPGRYRTQLAALGNAPAVTCSVKVWLTNGTVVTRHHSTRDAPAKAPSGRRGPRYTSTIFRTDALRRVGIPTHVRVDADTSLMWRWSRTHRLTPHVRQVLYEVHKRPGSLTTSPETGIGSLLRSEHKRIGRTQALRAVRQPARQARLVGYAPDPDLVRLVRSLLPEGAGRGAMTP